MPGAFVSDSVETCVFSSWVTGATKRYPRVGTVWMYCALILVVPERLAQRRHGKREVRVLHEGVGPQSVHQLLFRDEPSCVLDQIHRQIEGLGGQGYVFSPA